MAKTLVMPEQPLNEADKATKIIEARYAKRAKSGAKRTGILGNVMDLYAYQARHNPERIGGAFLLCLACGVEMVDTQEVKFIPPTGGGHVSFCRECWEHPERWRETVQRPTIEPQQEEEPPPLKQKRLSPPRTPGWEDKLNEWDRMLRAGHNIIDIELSLNVDHKRIDAWREYRKRLTERLSTH